MGLKYEDYAHHFDAYDMTEEQKRAHFQALENIMRTVIDWAWAGKGPVLEPGDREAPDAAQFEVLFKEFAERHAREKSD